MVEASVSDGGGGGGGVCDSGREVEVWMAW